MANFIYEKSGYMISLLIYFVYQPNLPKLLDVWYWDVCLETILMEMVMFWILIKLIEYEKIAVFFSEILGINNVLHMQKNFEN